MPQNDPIAGVWNEVRDKKQRVMTAEQWYANRKIECVCGHLGINHDPEDGNCEVGPPCEKKCVRFEAQKASGPSLPREETRATWYEIALKHILSKEWDNEFIEQQEFESYLGWLISKLEAFRGAASPAEGPTVPLIKCTNCDGYVMFKRVSPSEIEIIHNCEGDWYEEVSALLTKAGIPEREAGVEPGSESFISLERRVQMVIDRASGPKPSPCCPTENEINDVTHEITLWLANRFGWGDVTRWSLEGDLRKRLAAFFTPSAGDEIKK